MSSGASLSKGPEPSVRRCSNLRPSLKVCLFTHRDNSEAGSVFLPTETELEDGLEQNGCRQLELVGERANVALIEESLRICAASFVLS